ncbi:MAG: polysaccharide biosynthesis protein [Planctomycetales bacterium]|nr:polysaccharide biosynthesis protein [Planctomycetales bacterium]
MQDTQTHENSCHWLERLMARRIYLLIGAYLGILSASYALAYQLRFDFDVQPKDQNLFWSTLPWVVTIKMLMFYQFGSFHGWWRYVTFADLVSLIRVAMLSMAAISLFDLLFVPDPRIPLSVLLLDFGGTILLVGGPRSICRFFREHVWPSVRIEPSSRALLIGAEQGGESFVRHVHGDPRIDFRVVGFLDRNPAYRGSLLAGIPFLGSPDDAVSIARRQHARTILVMTHALEGQALRRLMDACRAAAMDVKMVPPLEQMLQGAYRLQVREVDINDLLRREPINIDSVAANEMLQGRCVLVTGAGGSIGSEICRQILRCRPERIVLVERAENNLYHIEKELLSQGSCAEIVPYVADARDYERMHAAFNTFQPQIVFHAAAHKHVPLMEANPGEAINNNVFGTKRMVDMAVQYGVERFVMISTDKAVNPTSVMGVSKMLAERYVHASSERGATRFVVVRFGNVLASAGSVVPLFQEQIRRGGPITVTHPDMERFFMTIPEASQLVLEAAAMGKGGEVFVLDMGEPVKILDLAHDLLRLSGLSPDDIEIRFTGMRPGEKLYEELYQSDEETMPTPHPKLRVAYHRPYSLEEVNETIAQLSPLVYESPQIIRTKLRELAPQYLDADLPGVTIPATPLNTTAR